MQGLPSDSALSDPQYCIRNVDRLGIRTHSFGFGSAGKITYSTMSAEQMVDLHSALDAAIVDVRKQFGQTHPMFINGQPVTAGKTFADESPIDTRWILGHFQSGGREHVKEAVAAARAA